MNFIKSLKGITNGVPIGVVSSSNASNSRRRSILMTFVTIVAKVFFTT